MSTVFLLGLWLIYFPCSIRIKSLLPKYKGEGKRPFLSELLGPNFFSSHPYLSGGGSVALWLKPLELDSVGVWNPKSTIWGNLGKLLNLSVPCCLICNTRTQNFHAYFRGLLGNTSQRSSRWWFPAGSARTPTWVVSTDDMERSSMKHHPVSGLIPSL